MSKFSQNNPLTQERLHQVLHYDPNTGIFKWKLQACNRIQIGDIAGCLCATHGYIRIRIDGRLYLASRLAWMYMFGQFPTAPYDEIDHWDRDKANNRFTNLFAVDTSGNRMNITEASPHNKSGLRGVAAGKDGRYRARASINGKKIWL